MPSPVTLRLDKETRERIARIARRKQISASQVIRRAIETWMEEQEPAGLPYEAISDLLGIVRGGNRARSAEGGRRFAAELKRRRGSQ
jgi:predicted DNA-binding protein